MDAVILAGGSVPPALQSVVTETERALIPIAGKAMISHVYDSLVPVTPVTRIIAVSTPGALALLPDDVVKIDSGEKMTQNLFAGLRAAESEKVLVVTGDGPLCTPRTWMQFLDGAAVNLLDAAYAVVREEQIEKTFPGAKRTYARFADGSFTGGNGFLIPKENLDKLETLIETAFASRKNPMGMAKLLGMSFIFKALTKRLKVWEAEEKVSGILGCKAGRVEVPDATIAFDVDKPEDLSVAETFLRK